MQTGGDNADPDLTNNSASTTALVANATGLTLRVEPASVRAIPGQPFTFNIRVSNAGGAPLSSIDVRGAIPPGLTLVSASLSLGTCGLSAASLHCQAETLASGSSMSVSVVAIAASAGDTPVRFTATSGTQSVDADLTVTTIPSSRIRAVRH